tara:strand:+ start:1652 stop:1891 length:240 start_codon:yes stop_codon:yes gene_type:complete
VDWVSRREEGVAEDSQASAHVSGPIEIPEGAMDCGNGVYIETLFEDGSNEPYYRTCSKGGATCRYSSDLWQAQIYAQYY